MTFLCPCPRGVLEALPAAAKGGISLQVGQGEVSDQLRPAEVGVLVGFLDRLRPRGEEPARSPAAFAVTAPATLSPTICDGPEKSVCRLVCWREIWGRIDNAFPPPTPSGPPPWQRAPRL